MKKFILGFVVGAIIMIALGVIWPAVMPDFLGGRWDITTANPIITNPISLWCDKLSNNVSEFGNVAVKITKNKQPVSDLAVLLSTEKPPLAPYSDGTMIPIPKTACFINTGSQGTGIFKKVPVGTAYIFFNNDKAAYPKRFGKPNTSIISVDIKNKETATTSIELD